MNSINLGLAYWSAALVSALVALPGCGDGSFAPVEGVVTVGGNPLAGASVVFTPEDGSPRSFGETAGDGTFSLVVESGEKQPGAKVGPHRVTISAVDFDPGAASDSSLGSLVTITGGQPRMRSLIHPKYGQADTSGLVFEVETGKTNRPTFDLIK